jgi:hypothetical protein
MAPQDQPQAEWKMKQFQNVESRLMQNFQQKQPEPEQ